MTKTQAQREKEKANESAKTMDIAKRLAQLAIQRSLIPQRVSDTKKVQPSITANRAGGKQMTGKIEGFVTPPIEKVLNRVINPPADLKVPRAPDRVEKALEEIITELTTDPVPKKQLEIDYEQVIKEHRKAAAAKAAAKAAAEAQRPPSAPTPAPAPSAPAPVAPKTPPATPAAPPTPVAAAPPRAQTPKAPPPAVPSPPKAPKPRAPRPPRAPSPKPAPAPKPAPKPRSKPAPPRSKSMSVPRPSPLPPPETAPTKPKPTPKPKPSKAERDAKAGAAALAAVHAAVAAGRITRPKSASPPKSRTVKSPSRPANKPQEVFAVRQGGKLHETVQKYLRRADGKFVPLGPRQSIDDFRGKTHLLNHGDPATWDKQFPTEMVV
jgi:hypothetical protein